MMKASEVDIDRLLALLVLSTFWWAGCGGAPPSAPTGSFGGTVLLDGAPLSAGTITFIPLRKNHEVTAEITEGLYQIDGTARLPAGRTRVEVRDSASRLPERYNPESKLVVDIVPGQKKQDFNLSSKP